LNAFTPTTRASAITAVSASISQTKGTKTGKIISTRPAMMCGTRSIDRP
jgi:hypothetical protein